MKKMSDKMKETNFTKRFSTMKNPSQSMGTSQQTPQQIKQAVGSVQTMKKSEEQNNELKNLKENLKNLEEKNQAMEEYLQVMKAKESLNNQAEFNYHLLTILQSIDQNLKQGLNSISQQIYDSNRIAVNDEGEEDEQEQQEPRARENFDDEDEDAYNEEDVD